MAVNIKDLVKDNRVYFEYYRAGYLYYTVKYGKGEEEITYLFPVPIDDIGNATFAKSDKAMYFMRYIRKAIKEGTLVNYY